MVDEDQGNLQSRVFFIWGSFCFFCIAFVWTMIYETKGLALEQVDELYGTVTKAWKSKDFRPTISFLEVQGAARKGSLAEFEEEKRRQSEGVAEVEREGGAAGK